MSATIKWNPSEILKGWIDGANRIRPKAGLRLLKGSGIEVVGNGVKPVPAIRKGTIRIYRQDTRESLFNETNIITDNSGWLFALLMASTSPTALPAPQYQNTSIASKQPAWGVWGLALGSGDPSWSQTAQPVETAQQTAIIAPLARVQLSLVNFVSQDQALNWSAQPNLTTNVEFQTTVNSTLNGIVLPVREIGLIGGGYTIGPPTNYTTDMQHAPFFTGVISNYSTVAAAQDTVILLNYKTLPSLNLPPGVNIIFSWIFAFGG